LFIVEFQGKVGGTVGKPGHCRIACAAKLGLYRPADLVGRFGQGVIAIGINMAFKADVTKVIYGLGLCREFLL
jgi:hypothetical protein